MPRVTKQTTKKKTSKTKSNSKSSLLLDQAESIEQEERGIKVNLYGRSGTGKTTLWATFPKPILSLVCSGAKDPGELLSIDTPEYRKTIKRFVITESSQVTQLAEENEETGRYTTIVLDHATSLQDLILKEILELDELPAQFSWGLASQAQYGQVALQMKTRLRSILNLSCNVVIVAQEREFGNGEEESIVLPYIASALSPSVVGWLNPACDYIFETFIRNEIIKKKVKVGSKTRVRETKGKKKEFCIRTAPDEIYTTKFRVPKGRELPDVVVDPDYEKIMNLIRGVG